MCFAILGVQDTPSFLLQTGCKRTMLLRWLLCILLVTATAAFATPRPDPAYRLDQNSGIVQLGRHARYAPTQDHSPPVTDAAWLAHHWRLNTEPAINRGYQSQPHWIHTAFITQTLAETHWILEIANSQLDALHVFIYRNGEPLQEWYTGDQLPFRQRALPNRHFLFPLTLQAHQRYDLYLWVQNSEALEVPLLLAPNTRYVEYSSQRSIIDGVFYGILLIIVAYSFMLYLVLLDRTYLYYVAYVLSMLLFFLWQQGVLYQHVFPTRPHLQHLAPVFISLLIFLSIAMFFRQLLELPVRVPRIWFCYKVLLILHALYCLLILVLDYQLIIMLMVINTVISTILAASSIVKLAYGGSRSAQIVLAGWALLLFCLLFFTAAKTGIIYSDFMADYGLRLGISVEILIFSFALAFRIEQERNEKEQALEQANRERNERIRAQELALQNEKEARLAKEAALQAEMQQTERLQQLVNERTADLENTLQHLERANRELEKLSAIDALTGVFNRRTFDEKLQEIWLASQRQARPLSILLVDIDHFKHVNDSLGHQCGDYVLREFAALVKSLLHRPTDILTRYGGEEFAILLPDTPLHGAEVVASALVRHAAAHLYVWEGTSFHVTASVGVDSQAPTLPEDAMSLLTRADNALYQAKQQGRNRWVSYRATENPSLSAAPHTSDR